MDLEFEATVLDVREEQRVEGDVRWQLLLDLPGLEAQGLRLIEAVSRSGTRLGLPVLSTVLDEERRVWCVVPKPLAAGTVVRGCRKEPSGTEQPNEK